MKPLKTVFVITSFAFFASMPCGATLSPEQKNDTSKTSRTYLPIGKIKPKDIEKYTGKKLKLKERVALLFLKNKMKKTSTKQSQATLALIFGISSILFVAAGFFFVSTPWTAFAVLMISSLICALIAWINASKIKKNEPGRKKSVIAKILASISLAVLLGVAAIGLLVLAFYNSF